ncbi:MULTISPECIES: DMT family transporter [Brucella]|uniref:Arginine/ornithine antiporter ArcD n=1 Tax=Ochrobactrum soli TaxID=2448455 RepID=A0A2P9HGQ8_9HYPH|nr:MULTISPECIES: DMT family transporter [Brucella]RRD24615.1 DMT family transporter [Brucellaceae bacterium VT-16-1752]WHS33060.1 DMT family transporter [Brucella sp. NM4]WHT43163.1 DMT family transporter [Ochrobactrum sp. SSR]SPL63288.1 Arginine/ornithine antiporter ArcD [[Ochrobactrum] soli]
MTPKSQGYFFTILAVTIFAAQDGISKYLGTHYSPIFITMIRYWVFAIFVILLAMRSGGIVKVASTKRPFLQITRGVLLAAEIVTFIFGLSRAGMAMAQSVFQGAPLLVTMLSVPFLGEKVGWRRWTAIIIGLCGVLLIINPVNAHFDANILFSVAATFMFAIYAVATRAVSKDDDAMTSFFYTGVGGVVVLTAAGVFYLVPIAPHDWFWMAALCVCGISSHYCLIRAYDILEAGEVQPLTYLQLVIGAFIATLVFHETLTWNVIAGAFIVVGAGLFSMFRERSLSLKRTTSATTP